MTTMITKLSNGEELLGDFELNDDGTYRVSKPVVMQVLGVDPGTGELKVHMLPYIIADPDGNVERLRAESCLYVPQTVSTVVENEYLSSVTGMLITTLMPGQ